MVSATEVRELATAIEGAADESSAERLVFSLGGKGFAWTFMRRPAPKAKRVPDPAVLAVSCTHESKQMLLEAAPDIYFDDDHYRGYPPSSSASKRSAGKSSEHSSKPALN